MGFDKATWLPNGLGGELENQGLAKAFDINTSWQQKLNCEQEQGLQTIGKMRPQSTGHSIVFPQLKTSVPHKDHNQGEI